MGHTRRTSSLFSVYLAQLSADNNIHLKNPVVIVGVVIDIFCL